VSGYVKNFRFETQFDGDKVSMMLRQLEWGDFRALTSHANSDSEVISEFSKLLPKYLVKIEGLNDAAGVAVSIDDLTSVAYFVPLIGQCLKKLIEEATIKNPKASDKTLIAQLSEADVLAQPDREAIAPTNG
jgi:hypothetical protein